MIEKHVASPIGIKGFFFLLFFVVLWYMDKSCKLANEMWPHEAKFYIFFQFCFCFYFESSSHETTRLADQVSSLNFVLIIWISTFHTYVLGGNYSFQERESSLISNISLFYFISIFLCLIMIC